MKNANYSSLSKLCSDDTSVVRENDLATRERVNFVVDSSIMSRFRAYAKEKNRPMSRMVDDALAVYLNEPKETSLNNDFFNKNEIILYHIFEIIIYETLESSQCKAFMDKVREFFPNYAYTSCVLNYNSSYSTVLGTKICIFISDFEKTQFSCLLEHISTARRHMKIDIRLDRESL